jgi:predicted nucleic acid-binding protein
MTVVSNTSPLTSLAAIGQFDLLEALFGEIHISTGVVRELSFGGGNWPGATEVERASWVHVKVVSNQPLVDALRLDLDLGEAETIALALDLRADLVLLDEQAGRYAAQHFRLRAMGVVGLLVQAKKQGLVAGVRPHLDALRRQAGFYLNETVYQHALQLADES